jgi:nucleotide-binding universal stress UspA family protein
MFEIQTILHPTDFSENSERAFDVACTLARACGARLVVLHVAERSPAPRLELTQVLPRQEPLAELERRLRWHRPPDPGMRVEYRLEQGDAAGEVLAVARETGADLVVLGMHTRAGLGRLLGGGVADAVLRHAPCAVMVVRPQAAERPARDGIATRELGAPS